MHKQKKEDLPDFDSPNIHISGLERFDKLTGEWIPVEKKWITDLKNLTPEQKRSFKEKMIQINKELTEKWKRESTK